MSKKILSFLLALILVLGMVPMGVFADTTPLEDDDFKVVVSMEGLTLGQGFYAEPKAYTLDQINDLVSSEGYGPYTKDNLTAGIATLAFLKDHNLEYTNTGTWDSDAYLSGVKGIDKKNLNIPAVISENGGPSNDKNEGNSDDYLGEFDYSSESGWMITVNDFMIDKSCADFVLTDEDNKGKYLSDLGNTFVVRWQFTVSGFGADLGVDTGWGMTPYFTAAKKATLYAAYAESNDETKKATALPVMENLTASQADVDAAWKALKQEADNKTVTIKIAPSTVSAVFYEGDTATGAQISATDAGVNGNYHKYTILVPKGTYSYRAKDGQTELGGMSFTVGDEAEQDITLVRTNYYTTDQNIKNVGDYSVQIMPGSLKNVVNGTQYIDENKRVITPTLLWANGNGLVYNWSIKLQEDLAANKGVAPAINMTFANNLSATQNKTFTLSNLTDYEIIAPKGANVQMFNQLKNFNVEEIAETSRMDVDGGVSHIFRPVESANLTYRVSMNGKITRAGYMGTTEKTNPVIISFEENENPKSTENHVSDALKPKMENSMFVNVNRQNELNLDVDETYRLRAYRGAWEIINSDTANIMIEPDFNYKVISGGEHISMTPADNRCTGNAKNNWMDIKGVSKGIAIIEVSYDAIIIGGSGTGYSGQYGASDPSRTSLIVICVGEDSGTLDMKVKGRTSAFDTEQDTVYTIGDTASFAFTATVDGKNPTVSLSTDKGNSWKTVSQKDGCFVADGLVPGNNILKFSADGKVAYQVVRAAKVGYTVENQSRTGNKIYAGDKVTVCFTGTYMAIPKMSGIYNPSAHTLVYGNTSSASKQCGGYDLPSKCAITLTMPQTAGKAEFENGYIKSTMFCANDPMGAHRSVTDSGVGTNFSAVQLTFTCGVYPKLTFDVLSASDCVHVWGDETITVNHTAAKAGEKRYTCQKCGEYKIVATAKGACTKFKTTMTDIPATATKDGQSGGQWCSECHKILTQPTAVPALGYKTQLNKTLSHIHTTLSNPVFGSEWNILALARGEYLPLGNQYFESYYNNVKEYVKATAESVNLNGALAQNKSTENARTILALTSIGKDASNVNGVNLVEAYEKNGFAWTKKQGINGPIFALISLDSGNYLSTNTSLRKECVDFILEKELEGGGWALSGTAADPDITAMALQALVNYKEREDVVKAADRAISRLSSLQKENGGFASWGSVNSESCAQVITALTAWGINPDTDPRFVKESGSAVSAMLEFYVEDGGFKHVSTGELNGMATEQSAYALVAFDRFLSNKSSLYDMSGFNSTPTDLSVTISLPENVEKKLDNPINAIIKVNGPFSGYRMLDGIISVPECLDVVDVIMGEGISGGKVNYNEVEENNELRFAYADLTSGTNIKMESAEYPAELMRVQFKMVTDTDLTEIPISILGMSLKKSSEESEQVIIDTTSATDVIKFVNGFTVAAYTLYQGDGIDLIPSDKIAVEIAVTGIETGTDIIFKDAENAESDPISFFYSEEITTKTGIHSYVTIVSASLDLQKLLNPQNYLVAFDDTKAEPITFGDINADSIINAQDALYVVSFWLRQNPVNSDKLILTSNLNGDSRINTLDALAVVEYFVDGKEAKIVNIASTAENTISEENKTSEEEKKEMTEIQEEQQN